MPLYAPATVPTTSYPTGWRNLVHNGDMRICQRNPISTVPTLTQTNTIVDRWALAMDNGGAAPGASISCALDASVAPVGFPYCILATTTGADASIAAADLYAFQQGMEGWNIQQLMWGTASARPATLSFWCYVNNAGTYSGSIRNNIQQGASIRSFVFSWAMAANTWTKVVIAIPADTGGVASPNNNLVQLYLSFNMGSGTSITAANTGAWAGGVNAVGMTGSFNVANTANATFRFTGVQLEIGNAATPFESRPLSVELALCQRYFYITGRSTVVSAPLSTWGVNTSATTGFFNNKFPVPMRATPSLLTSLAAAPWATATVGIYATNRIVNYTVTALVAGAGMCADFGDLQATITSPPATFGQAFMLYGSAAQAYIAYAAEL